MIALVRGEAPDWLDVSRETLDRFNMLLSLVEKWNPAINLVASGSLTDGWGRHVIDSAQLFLLIPPNAKNVADFGSGAGFPGLVMAIMAMDAQPDLRVTLVEADKRKAAFLTQAARQLGLAVRVVTDRAEALAPLEADVVSARAMAPLSDLCALGNRHLAPDGIAIFPKGAQANAEVTHASKSWRFQFDLSQSLTDPAAQVVTLKNIKHA
jgi:16S rRNA (guanine527-N7)-methyltransferase